MLTAERRSQLYWDHVRVIAEMADAYNVFSRSLFFHPEMIDQYKTNRTKYVTYFTNIVRHMDVYFQEDQLTHTKLGFPLVPVPTYLPSNYELEQNDVCCIENAVHMETREVEHEMMIIMEESRSNNTNHSTDSFFSRLCSFELNNMGFGLNRISCIMFDTDAFQTPENRVTLSRVPTSTPREWCTEKAQQHGPQMNRTYPLKAVPSYTSQEQRHQSYDANTSARYTHPQTTQGRFVPPHQAEPADLADNSGSESGSQNSPYTKVHIHR